jgi:glutathione S-transferase
MGSKSSKASKPKGPLPKIKLISFDLCPYVQRAAIAMRELEIPYEIEYINIMNKPAWFLAISPRGKVPVLLVLL